MYSLMQLRGCTLCWTVYPVHPCRRGGGRGEYSGTITAPEFPEDGIDGVSTPSTKPKLSTAGSHPPPGSESDLPSTSVSPFVPSEGLPLVPAKLVAKIQKRDYVDMAELLHENMEWEC